jgi:hypothetical protein
MYPAICPHELILLHFSPGTNSSSHGTATNSLHSLDLEEVKAGDSSLLNEFKVEEAYDSESA